MQSTSKATVLLVEDDQLDARLITSALLDEAHDSTIRRYASGRNLLDALGEIPLNQVDLLILDWNTPGADGARVLAELEKVPAIQSIPIIVLTSSALSRDRELAAQHGAREFITKPIRHSAFVSTVKGIARRWLNQHEGVIMSPA